jgi:TetR/AcrR family transcriptional repressor of nem operon
MTGRPSLFDNDMLIERAQKVFWVKGYTATSLNDLLKGLEIGSGSFYNSFRGGKKELFSAVLKQRRVAFERFRKELEASDKPVVMIKNFFRGLVAADTDTYLRGCLVASAVTELAFVDSDLESEATAILKDVERMYASVIRAAQQNGTLKNQTDAILLGRYLITIYNGINVTRRMYPVKHQKQLRQLIELQLEIIK